MKFLIDLNLPPSWKKLLSDSGWANYRVFCFVGLACLALLSCSPAKDKQISDTQPVEDFTPQLLAREFPNHQFFDIKSKGSAMSRLEQLQADYLLGPSHKCYIAFSGSDPGILKQENGADPTHSGLRNYFTPTDTGKEIGTGKVFSLQTAFCRL